MNFSTYHPLQSFDLLAIGIALVLVLGVIGMKILTGRPWRRTLPPDEIDAGAFSVTSDVRPRATPPSINKDSLP